MTEMNLVKEWGSLKDDEMVEWIKRKLKEIENFEELVRDLVDKYMKLPQHKEVYTYIEILNQIEKLKNR